MALYLIRGQDVSVGSLAGMSGWNCIFLGKIQEVYPVIEPVESRAA